MGKGFQGVHSCPARPRGISCSSSPRFLILGCPPLYLCVVSLWLPPLTLKPGSQRGNDSPSLGPRPPHSHPLLLFSPPRPECPHRAKATSSGPPSSKMSASGHLYFLFLLLGSAPSSWTQGTSMAPSSDLMEKNHTTPSEMPPASSLSTALSPTTSELQVTSMDPTKDDEDTGQTQPENKMETTSAKGHSDPITMSSRTKPPMPPTSSGGEEKWDPFKSNEYTLRKRGLIAAAVLFITGILILTSDRCRQFRWCRRQQRSAYRVTQA
ncbi:FXYD domain-containing ion transport regulator 5 isoform X2 [Sminthopsis crassicaudata]|uniref:FXYD domain-containing ion transport regulator 5 isoform X2 n=2 Tax=Sminthopsis crassicaudata TaxID=9301 RepID=UPI003D697F94